MVEDILSPEGEDDGTLGGDDTGAGRETGSGSCCNSSHFSDNNKSEKNMSDFDGEGVLSDEELSMAAACHIGSRNAGPASASSRQHSSIATLYPLQTGGQRPTISAQGDLTIL